MFAFNLISKAELLDGDGFEIEEIGEIVELFPAGGVLFGVTNSTEVKSLYLLAVSEPAFSWDAGGISHQRACTNLTGIP